MGMSRREVLRAGGGVALSTAIAGSDTAPKPNIILILADDLGFGDLGCYGSKIQTPNLNRMARDGILFRQFYGAAPVCSASRAGLLTGRYGVRGGVPGVLSPSVKTGLSVSETTIAGMLKSSGYRTACVGKWHLGSEPQYLPTARGFDDYYGIPYSNDQFPSVLMQGTTVIESPVNLDTITGRYTQQAVNFIRQNKDSPFFSIWRIPPCTCRWPCQRSSGENPLWDCTEMLCGRWIGAWGAYCPRLPISASIPIRS